MAISTFGVGARSLRRVAGPPLVVVETSCAPRASRLDRARAAHSSIRYPGPTIREIVVGLRPPLAVSVAPGCRCARGDEVSERGSIRNRLGLDVIEELVERPGGDVR